MNSTWIFSFLIFAHFWGVEKLEPNFPEFFFGLESSNIVLRSQLIRYFLSMMNDQCLTQKNVIKMRVLNGLFSLQNPQTLVIIW